MLASASEREGKERVEGGGRDGGSFDEVSILCLCKKMTVCT